jgi:hypothetical protein
MTRSETIITLTGTSIALSVLIFFFSCVSSSFSFDFGPPVAILTIIYHVTILILSRRNRNSPNASPYPTKRPAIGLAAFLFLVWSITVVFMVVSLVKFMSPFWNFQYLVKLWAQFILAVGETGVMLSIVLISRRARRSLEAAEGAGQIQI